MRRTLLRVAGVASLLVGLVALAVCVRPTQDREQGLPTRPAFVRASALPPSAGAHRDHRSGSDDPPTVRPGAAGTLQVPNLGIEAPVDAVGLDGSAMAIPTDPTRLGWLTGTAKPGDLVGASVVSGHVSDRDDRPGALSRLDEVRPRATIIWTDSAGRTYRFRVERVRLFSRDHALPAWLFATDGPHVLHLITCAGRISTPGGGFHYRSNLVVTAVG